MGRPRIYQQARVTTAIRLSPELRAELHERAKLEGRSANELVVRALQAYLRHRARTRGRP